MKLTARMETDLEKIVRIVNLQEWGVACSSLVPALRVVITAVPVRILIFLLVVVKAMEYKDIFIYYKNVVKQIYFLIMNCTTSNNHNDWKIYLYLTEHFSYIHITWHTKWNTEFRVCSAGSESQY